ncbi:hypothetical protein L9F63_000131, partial [Diploptera punctata]
SSSKHNLVENNNFASLPRDGIDICTTTSLFYFFLAFCFHLGPDTSFHSMFFSYFLLLFCLRGMPNGQYHIPTQHM